MARGDGNVFRRGDMWWIRYCHNGTQIRESAKTDSEKKARALLRERLRTVGTPGFIAPDAQRVTFGDLADAYLVDYRINARRSLRDAERIVRRLRETFGMDKALAITSTRIEAFKLARLEAGAKPATVNRELAALRRMFSIATKTGRLPSKPHVAMLDESGNARQGFVEPAAFDAIVAHLPSDVADLAVFAYHAAWRRGECVTLEWRDVSLTDDGGRVTLRPERSKTKRGRTLVLGGPLLDVIRRRAAVRTPACVYVFHRDGRPIRDFRTVWKAAREAAGYGALLFHDLRRSGVRNMIRAGVSQTVAMKISGHKTAAVFARYDITSDADIAAAVEQTAGYVERQREAAPIVATLAAAREKRTGTA